MQLAPGVIANFNNNVYIRVNGSEQKSEQPPLEDNLHIKNVWLQYLTLHRTRLKSCDMQRELYTLYNERDNVVYNMTAHACERPFVVLPIPNSNLILLVIDLLCPREVNLVLTVNPKRIQYPLAVNETFSCYKNAREFTRVRPQSCISRHANVSRGLILCSSRSFTDLLNFLSITLHRRAASSCVAGVIRSIPVSRCYCFR